MMSQDQPLGGDKTRPNDVNTCGVSILVLVERPFGPANPQHVAYRIRFQSLFWWRGHLDEYTGKMAGVWLKFQSLFWWRGHLD